MPGSAWAVVVAVLFVACEVPSAQAVPQPLVFNDSIGDVTRNREPFTGPLADANDIVSFLLEEEGSEFKASLELKDLSGLEQKKGDGYFHAQYAVYFATTHASAGFGFRATYRGSSSDVQGVALPPYGQWSFQIHDKAKDTWPTVTGDIQGSVIHWMVSFSQFGVAAGDRMSAWSVSAWNSYAAHDQSNDALQTPIDYEVGKGPLDPAEEVPSVPGGGFSFSDPAQDVTVGGSRDPYTGPGAETDDVLSVSLSEAGASLVFTLTLSNLSGLHGELADPGFDAQYSVGFITPGNNEGYEARASFGGERYTHDSNGAWRFSIHDRKADTWPGADATVRGSSIIWMLPRSAFGVQSGDQLRDWSVATWNSYDDGYQYGDHAATERVYVLREPDAPRPETRDGPSSPVAPSGSSSEFPIPGFSGVTTPIAAAIAGGAILRRIAKKSP